jgi:3-(3-hydroxy-phenyl)propionate hydroxylase
VEVDIVWVGPYAYRSICLDQLRVGRVFFMGDTAKVVSPFGARGGNTGIADADNLAWKLAAVQRGWAAPALLDSYNDERLEAAQQNVLVTNRTARFLRAPEGVERLFRSAAISLAKQPGKHYGFARQFINTGRMAIANPYTRSRACDATGGLSVQNTAVGWPRAASPAQGTVNDLLQWAAGKLLVLVFGDLSPAAIERLRALGAASPIVSVQVVATDGQPQVLEHVHDSKGHLQAACHVFGHAWALVRPDGYVAVTGEAVDASLVAALEKSLGLV